MDAESSPGPSRTESGFSLKKLIARRGAAIRWTSLLVIAFSLILLMRALPIDRFVDDALRRVDDLGYWGPMVLGVAYVVAVLLLVPGSVLTLAISALYGLVEGMVIVSLAATTAAALAFLIARYTLRERVRRWVERSPKLAAVDRAIGEQGWKLVALLRLSPAVPFNLQNYLYGVTAIRFWPCVLTSWIAMLPGTFLYVYIGSLGRTAVSGQTTTGEWILRGVGLLATVLVTVYITRLARRAIRQRTDINDSAATTDRPAFAHGPVTARALWGTLIMAGLAIILLGFTLWSLASAD